MLKTFSIAYDDESKMMAIGGSIPLNEVIRLLQDALVNLRVSEALKERNNNDEDNTDNNAKRNEGGP